MKKTYVSPSISRDRAARVQEAAARESLLNVYEKTLCTDDANAVILPPSVSADVAAAVRSTMKKRAAFMADRQDVQKAAAPDMDAPSMCYPFVAYYVPSVEYEARKALPRGQRKAFVYSRVDEMPFMMSARVVDLYALWGMARAHAEQIVPNGMVLDTVYLDMMTADGRADGEALTAAARHVAKRTIKNALDTSGRYTADGRYTVQVYMYADICRPDPVRADVQDLISAAALGMMEAISDGLPLRDVYAAAYKAANVQIDGEKKTAANTIYMDANAGNDDAPLSDVLVSVKGSMRAIIAADTSAVSDFDAPPSVPAGKRAALDWIMSQLTPTQKDGIERRALGQSMRQIAAARGCRVSAVHKSIELARKKAAALYPDIAAEYAADVRAEYGAHIAAAADAPTTVMHDGVYSNDEHMTAAAAFAAVGAQKARAALTLAAARYDRNRAAADALTDTAAARAAHRAAFVEFETVRERARRAIETAVHAADTADVYAGVEAAAARADEAARRLADKAAKSAAIAAKTDSKNRANAAARAARLATAAKNAAARADEARRAADEAAAAREAARAERAARIHAKNAAARAFYAADADTQERRRAARQTAAARVVYGKGRLPMSDVLYIRNGIQMCKGRAPRVMYTRYDTLETVSAFELTARQIAAYKAARR